MATVINHSSHVENAIRFLEKYSPDPDGSDRLYLASGRPGLLDGQTPPEAWPDPQNPDTPLDTLNDINAFWDSIIGMKKIATNRIIPVVPRINWTTGSFYVTLDSTANAASTTAYNSTFYTMNSQYRVYKCIKSHAIEASTSEPLKAAEDLGTGIITGADGYDWLFLYKLSQVVVDNLLSDTWLPVNFDENYITDTGSPDYEANARLDAIQQLGSKYVLIQITLEGDDTQIGAVGTIYRQTAIISNPLDADGTDKMTVELAGVGDLGVNGFTIYSGNMLHLENKGSITRAADQTEIVQTILQF